MDAVLLFSGQGAQKVGMGKDLYDQYPAARALIEQADKALGESLSSIMFEGPGEELTRTCNCQPALYVHGLACLAVLKELAPSLNPVAAGCKIAKKLNVAGAYHSRLMHSAMVKLAEELKNVSFGTPSMPVYCNYEARVVEGPDDIRNVLEHQVCGSVRWTASMQKLVDQGHRLFIELGPGKTLAGMMGRICKDATVISIEDVPSLEAAVAELNK